MDSHALIGRVITRSQKIEGLLRTHYPTHNKKRGIFAALKELQDTLPAVLSRTIKIIAIARNGAAHPEEFKPEQIPPDFDRLCDDVELLIPFFAHRRQNVKNTRLEQQPELLTAKPKAIAATSKPKNKTIAANVPDNYGKQWTPEEDRKLAEAFDAHASIPELARIHQRGVGGIQSRLTKLGKLTADQYENFPPEALFLANA